MCHWLLVKRNEVGSVARKKMLKAWFMMSACGNTPRPKIQSMRDYAKYRNEIGIIMSEIQSGKNNSQYGKHWFTNRDTGESKRLKIAPNEKWIFGRNLFRGERSVIPLNKEEKRKRISDGLYAYYKINGNPKKGKHYVKPITRKRITVYNILTLEKLIITEGIIPKNYTTNKSIAFHNVEKIKTRKLWDLFNNGEYKSINAFSKTINMSQPLLTSKFRNYIPLYCKLSNKRFTFKPNKNYIGVYE